MTRKIIVGISGASGAIYGIRLLEILKKIENVETHLIISKNANITISQETSYNVSDVESLANFVYNPSNLSAAIASGSFKISEMIVAPSSIKTMSEIAYGTTSNLLSRAADVILKEQKKLILMVRETPLHLGHLRTMVKLAEIGAIISPPVPAFYTKPNSIDDIINHNIGRILDLIGLDTNLVNRWEGIKN